MSVMVRLFSVSVRWLPVCFLVPCLRGGGAERTMLNKKSLLRYIAADVKRHYTSLSSGSVAWL